MKNTEAVKCRASNVATCQEFFQTRKRVRMGLREEIDKTSPKRKPYNAWIHFGEAKEKVRKRSRKRFIYKNKILGRILILHENA